MRCWRSCPGPGGGHVEGAGAADAAEAADVEGVVSVVDVVNVADVEGAEGAEEPEEAGDAEEPEAQGPEPERPVGLPVVRGGTSVSDGGASRSGTRVPATARTAGYYSAEISAGWSRRAATTCSASTACGTATARTTAAGRARCRDGRSRPRATTTMPART